MKAYLFPGQASQFPGMGKDMYEQSDVARHYFDRANEILGYRITDIMFEGSEEELKETRITQPAVFLHSVVKAFMAGDAFAPDAVAGHSLGEFSALVAAGALGFDDGLNLVRKRAEAMQKACEMQPSTMAAVLGMEDAVVETICQEIDDIVVPANYNCPGQLVISGTVSGVEEAVKRLSEAGARSAVVLKVGGAFHSPLMMPAQEELRTAIEAVAMKQPVCPVYQNVDAKPYTDVEAIRANLLRQLTSPVYWTQTMQNMMADGMDYFYEVGGTGKVLRGFIARINRQIPTETLLP
jgi:[acyl-carrier-protein] S-malonyltransferase